MPAAIAARSLEAELAYADSPAAPMAYSSAARDPAALDISVVTTRTAFDALEEDWNGLFERSARSHQLFMSFNWLWHWCNHYLPHSGTELQLHIVTARRAGRLVMAWPLVKARSRGLTVLSWMGDPVSQYGDVLVEDGPDAAGLLAAGWRHIERSSGADVVRLRKVRADAAVAPFLAKLGGEPTETLTAPYLDLASAKGYSDYEQRYSGGARRNRRRLLRRLEEQGAVTFEELTGGPEARALISLAVDLKRKWLKARGLVSKAFADDRFTHFFADIADAPEKPAGCRVAVLKSAGRPVAIEVALGCGDRMALHIIVFDLEFEKSGAGVLLLEQSFRNAANGGAGCYDLLAPGDEYKTTWADAAVTVDDWALPLSVKGRIYARAYLGLLRKGMKRAMAALPAGVRRQIADALSRVMAKA